MLKHIWTPHSMVLFCDLNIDSSCGETRALSKAVDIDCIALSTRLSQADTRSMLKQCLKEKNPTGCQKSSLGHWDLREADECACFTRVTLQVQQSDLLKALTPGHRLREKHDIIAIQPLSANAFQAACRELDIDLIHFDLNEKLPFQLRPQDLAAACNRGVHVEFCYRQMVKGSIDSCALFNSQAREICRVTRGRNLVISSAAKALYELRGPFNICALAIACGLQPAEAKASVTTNCLAVLKHAARQKGLRLDRHWPTLPKLQKAASRHAGRQQTEEQTGSETRKRKAASQPVVEAAAVKRSKAAASVKLLSGMTQQCVPGDGTPLDRPLMERARQGGSIQAEEKRSRVDTKDAVQLSRTLQGLGFIGSERGPEAGGPQPSSAEDRAPLEGRVPQLRLGSGAKKAGNPPKSNDQAAAPGEAPFSRSLQALMLGHGQELQQISQPAQPDSCLPAADIGNATQPERGQAELSSQGARGGVPQLLGQGLPPWKRPSQQQQPEASALPMGRRRGQGKKEKGKKGGGLGGGGLGRKKGKTRKGWRD